MMLHTEMSQVSMSHNCVSLRCTSAHRTLSSLNGITLLFPNDTYKILEGAFSPRGEENTLFL